MGGRRTTTSDLRGRARSPGASLAAALALAAAAGCRTPPRPFLWVENAPSQQPEAAEYRIGAGDVLGVRVWNQETLSTSRAKVRNDGKISLPFLQDVEVSGMTPPELATRLQAELKPYIVLPVVTVTLEERAPLHVSVLGEVVRPGAYDLPPGAGVLHALAAAGGLTPYAPRDGIYVLRTAQGGERDRAPARIRFRYRELAGGMVPAATFRLRGADVIVVE